MQHFHLGEGPDEATDLVDHLGGVLLGATDSGEAEAGALPQLLMVDLGGSDKAKDLFGLFDDTLGRLLAAIK